MTKTLTEQWREGTLPDGYYYITSKKWGMLIDRYRDQINDCGHKWRGFDNCQGVVEEVLAPVPSYEEFKSNGKCADMLIDVNKKWEQTIKANKMYGRKLDIAIKALKEYADRSNWIEGNFMCVYDGKSFADEESAEQALKEMEGVK